MNHALRWELLGAAIGAGMASGREAASFFGRYGNWGFLAIPLACAVMAALAPTPIPDGWQGRWPARCLRILQSLLLTATAGAMLCASGETAALLLPGRVNIPAMALTLLISWLLARRTVRGLTAISRGLLAVLTALVLAGLTAPPLRAAAAFTSPVTAPLRAAAYGGFNAALMAPLLLESPASPQEKRREARRACAMVAAFLLAAQALLLRHPALMGEPLPFLRMTASLGRWGLLLSAAGLYLASLSTLTACLTALRSPLALAGILLCASLGFTGAVDVLYPLLGGGCLLLLTAAKFTNYWRNTFHSRRDML